MNEEKATIFRKVRANIMLKEPFLGALAMALEPEFIGPAEGFLARVDENNRIGLPDAFFELSKEQQVFVYCHEILHVALEHFSRGTNKDWKLWGIATDLVINDILKSAGFSAPHGVLYDPSVSREKGVLLSAEQVYQRIKDDKKYQKESNFDAHPQAGKGSRSPGNKEMERIRKVVESFSIMPGNQPGSIVEYVRKLNKPKVDWKEVLKRYVSSKISEELNWARRKTYLPRSIYIPQPKKDFKINVVVAVDVSGSISTHQLERFFSEVAAILRAYSQVNCRVLEFDTRIHKDVNLNNVGEIEVVGRGGTDFACIKEYLTEKKITHDVLIVMSDGYAFNSEMRLSNKTIYLITNNRSFRTSHGVVIYIEE